MTRFLAWHVAFCTAPYLTVAAFASVAAQVPQPPIAGFGDYACSIESSIGVASSGKTYALNDAPSAFVFSAYESPVTPEELRNSPLRALDRDLSGETRRHEPEAQRVFSASIAPDLFAAPAQALRTTDLSAFHQGGVSIVFEKDLSFVAYGPAQGGGVAVYAGSCTAPQQ